MKDKTTKKPVVITHFRGFDNQAEADDFSEFLKYQFITEDDFDNSNKTLH